MTIWWMGNILVSFDHEVQNTEKLDLWGFENRCMRFWKGKNSDLWGFEEGKIEDLKVKSRVYIASIFIYYFLNKHLLGVLVTLKLQAVRILRAKKVDFGRWRSRAGVRGGACGAKTQDG